MSSIDQAARATERNAQRVQDAAQESWSQIARSFADSFDNVRGFHLRTIEMLRSHADASFDLAEKLITAKSPDQVMGAWKSFADQEVETINKHSGELAELTRDAVNESVQSPKEAARRT